MTQIDFNKRLKEIKEIKSKNNFSKTNVNSLHKLPKLSGVLEFSFKEHIFFMLNLNNDDGVALKYLYRDYYENTSLSLWYDISKQDGALLDVGAHTGIYTIISNLANSKNNTISLEPYYMNYARLVSNLKLNNIDATNAIMCALSDECKQTKLQINTNHLYHTSGGRVSDAGNTPINTIELDSLKVNKKVIGIKIDTEGHEHKVLKGGYNTIKNYLPDIILEINKESFLQCFDMLKSLSYNAYYIDEENNKLSILENSNINFDSTEGMNAFFSINKKII